MKIQSESYPMPGDTIFHPTEFPPITQAAAIASKHWDVTEPLQGVRDDRTGASWAVKSRGGYVACIGYIDGCIALLDKLPDGGRKLTIFAPETGTTDEEPLPDRSAAMADAVEFVLSAISNYGDKNEAIDQAEDDYGLKFTKDERAHIRGKALAEWQQGQREAGVTPMSDHDRRRAFRDIESGK